VKKVVAFDAEHVLVNDLWAIVLRGVDVESLYTKCGRSPDRIAMGRRMTPRAPAEYIVVCNIL